MVRTRARARRRRLPFIVVSLVLAAAIHGASSVRASTVAGPIGAVTTVSDPNAKGVVTITVPIDVPGGKGVKLDVPDGKGGTRTVNLVDYWEQTAEEWWNNAFDFLPYKDCFTLHLDVVAKTFREGFRGRPGHHVIQVGQGGSGVPGFDGGNPNNPRNGSSDGPKSFNQERDGIWRDDLTPAMIAHEVGHLIGLGDDYVVVRDPSTGKPVEPRQTRPKPGRTGTMMADGGVIDTALVDRIGRQLENLLGGLPCSRWSGPVHGTQTGPTCDGTEDGTIALGVRADGSVLGHIDTAGSYTCDPGITVPTEATVRLTGTLDDGTFRLDVPDVSRTTPSLTPVCLVGHRPRIRVERGKGSVELSSTPPSGDVYACSVTVEREPEGEPVG